LGAIYGLTHFSGEKRKFFSVISSVEKKNTTEGKRENTLRAGRKVFNAIKSGGSPTGHTRIS